MYTYVIEIVFKGNARLNCFIHLQCSFRIVLHNFELKTKNIQVVFFVIFKLTQNYGFVRNNLYLYNK